MCIIYIVFIVYTVLYIVYIVYGVFIVSYDGHVIGDYALLLVTHQVFYDF